MGLKCLNGINRNLLLVRIHVHAVLLLYLRLSAVGVLFGKLPPKCLARPGYRHGTCRWYCWGWRRGFGIRKEHCNFCFACSYFIIYWHWLRREMCHQCYQQVFQTSSASSPFEDELDVDEVSWSWGPKHIRVSSEVLELFYAVVGCCRAIAFEMHKLSLYILSWYFPRVDCFDISLEWNASVCGPPHLFLHGYMN